MMSKKEYCEALGRCIREARKERGGRRTDFCRDADVESASLSRYENGKHMPTMRTVLKICGALRGDEDKVDEAKVLRSMKKNLRAAMAEKGHTIRSFRATGIGANIHLYSAGRTFPEPYTLSCIAEVLGVRPSDLVPGTEELLGRMG